ncbi:MAG: siphovirus Gp157 family protein [Anaerostipes faecalis]|nr:siphovirus Gp157 family protein [Anaerostipes faecalis]
MATLYELKEEYKDLLMMAEEQNLTQADIKDTIEGMDYEFEDKADNYARMIRILDGNITAFDSEIKRLTDMKRVSQNNIKVLKKNLENAMIETGKTKFKTTLFSFGIQKNPPTVKIDDESKVPEEFRVKQPDKIDKRRLIKALKDGQLEENENIILIQPESLRIR